MSTKMMEKAKVHLLLSKNGRFYGGLASNLDLVEEVGCDMIGTNGKIIKFDPEIVKLYNLEELKTIVAHEICHVTLEHHYRFRNEPDHDMVNEACDYVVNLILEDAGFVMPKDCLLDHSYKGMSANDVLTILKKKKQQEKQQNNQNQKQDSSGNNQGQKQSSESGKEQEQIDQNQSQDQNQKEQDSKSNQKQQSSEGNEQKEAPKWGKVINAPKENEQEEKKKWQQAVGTAAKICGGYGNLPGATAEMVKDIVDPVIPWTVLLRDFVDRTANNDYTYARPNRRYIQSGLIFPVLQSDELRKIIFVVDTSGSISQYNFAEVEGELQDIINLYNVTLEVHYVDYKHHPEATQVFEKYDTVKLKPYGRGGTSFKPIFEYIKNIGEEPACLIYFTDLWGSFPKEEPDYPVLWIQLGNEKMEVPFGEIYNKKR